MNRKLIIALVILSLVAAIFLAYWNAPRGSFIWDDINLVVLDYQIKSWNYLNEIFTRDFFGFSDDNRKYGYYRPLITISYAFDYQLWGLNPSGYHYTNILIHIICTILLFFIFYRLFGRRLLIPTIAGLLFAVNPIHTESVTWIAGRTDPMAALFFFAGLLAFMVYAERLAAAKQFEPLPPGADAHAAHRRRLPMLALSVVFLLLGMLAKEIILALPLVCAVYVLVYVTGWRWRRVVTFAPAFLLQALTLGAYSLYRTYRVGFSQQAKNPFELIEVILTFIKTIPYYVAKIMVPVHLSAYIQNPLVESVFEAKFIAAFLFMALVVAVIWQTFRRDRVVAFSLLFLLAALGPISNLIRISGPKDMGFMTAERFIYIASAAVVLLMGVWLGRLIGRLGPLTADRDWSAGRPARRIVAVVMLAVILVSYTALSLRRNTDWYDNERMFTKMIDDAPNATLLYVVLGNIYRMNKKYDKAEQVLQKALEYVAPRNREEPTWIYNDLAGIYAEQGRFDEALRVMKSASRTREHNSAVQYNYGEIYRAMGDCRTAIRFYQRSLVIYRDNLNALVKQGMCFQTLENWELSNKSFITALSLTPHDPNLLNQVGFNYYRLGMYDKAEQYLTVVLAKRSNHTAARINLALVRFKQDLADEAVIILQELLAQEPDNVDVLATLGHVLANRGDFVEAGKHIMQALKLEPKNLQARLTYATVAMETNPTHAREVLLGILKDRPQFAEAMFAMGLSYQREDKVEQAAEWYRKTLSASPLHRRARSKLLELGIESTPTMPAQDIE